MCLLCKDTNGTTQIAKNYLLGIWSRESLEAHHEIIEKHASKGVPSPNEFFAEMHDLIELLGRGERAWEVLYVEIRAWRIEAGNYIPGPEIEIVTMVPDQLVTVN